MLNGCHNWPGAVTVGKPPVATQFNATEAIIDGWRLNAGLP